jgi:predicted peptidase
VKRLARLSILCLILASCTGATATHEPTAAPTISRTPSPTGTRDNFPTDRPELPPSPAASDVTPSNFAWPAGLTAYASVDGRLPYLEYLPPGYGEDGLKSPLLIFLHGAGEYGDGSEQQLSRVLVLGLPAMIANGDWPAEQPFVVLMPQYRFAEANSTCAIGSDLERFIGQALTKYNVDPRRIYLTGISCGAIAIYDYLAAERDYPIAAVVPISGHPGYVIDTAGCDLVRTPIWAFHGALDEIVRFDWLQGLMTELQECTDPAPADLIFTVYPDGHHDSDTWDLTYDGSSGNDIYEWLLGHRVGH